jgi:hypothetical protein
MTASSGRHRFEFGRFRVMMDVDEFEKINDLWNNGAT